jgi:hypothetical protein
VHLSVVSVLVARILQLLEPISEEVGPYGLKS